MLIPKVNLIADKFITGSAFVAMKDIALYRTVSNAPSACTYSNLFSEDGGVWMSAILYADAVFGPFAGVKEWVHTKNITVQPRPMRHEFYMVLPHLERDAVVRCEHFDTSQQYDFYFRPASEVTQEGATWCKKGVPRVAGGGRPRCGARIRVSQVSVLDFDFYLAGLFHFVVARFKVETFLQ